MSTPPATSSAVPVLMYHSISDGYGPTCIPPGVFRDHLDALADLGWRVVSLSRLAEWLRGDAELEARTAVITFDDGFRDFGEAAFGPLDERQMAATVFLPSRCVGGVETWTGANDPPRPLMDWPDIRRFADAGIDFGGHSLTHADLTRLPEAEMHDEVRLAKEEIEDRIGHPVTTFAAPYGHSNEAVRAEIARHYEIAPGVRLAKATPGSDPYDVPRIEMHYFRDVERWRTFLTNDADLYFAWRRTLREVRRLAWGR